MALFIATPGCSLFGALLLVPYFTENSAGRPGNRPVCQVTVSYSAVPDETAVDDVLGMLINANYAR
jgi:hypothetical protein